MKKMQSRAMFQTCASLFPSERPETFITSKYNVFVFRDIEAVLNEASNMFLTVGCILEICLLSRMRTRMKRKGNALFLTGLVLVQAAKWHTIFHSVYSIDASRGL